MKDSEFIELLNLYLDHEITAADAARLEAEVQGNPARRRIYQQYCRMQKACAVLAKDFNEQAATTEPAGESRKVLAFEPAHRSAWGTGTFAVSGLLAAAACVALVLINRTTETAPATGAAVAVAAMPPAAPVVAQAEANVIVTQPEAVASHASIVRTVTMPTVRRNELQPVLAARFLTLGDSVNPGEQVASAELPAQLDWISGLKIAPMQRVQADDLRFEARPVQQPKVPSYGSPRRTDHGIIEKTAFQFQQ